MSRPDFRHAVWHKSSRSGGDGNCVEVAFTGTVVGVRDSKDLAGPVLAIGPAGWSALLTSVERDEIGPI
ncbi:MAG: DUF397 domain-containing protein [Pseudonocardiaceae bacterium]